MIKFSQCIHTFNISLVLFPYHFNNHSTSGEGLTSDVSCYCRHQFPNSDIILSTRNNTLLLLISAGLNHILGINPIYTMTPNTHINTMSTKNTDLVFLKISPHLCRIIICARGSPKAEILKLCFCLLIWNPFQTGQVKLSLSFPE